MEAAKQNMEAEQVELEQQMTALEALLASPTSDKAVASVSLDTIDLQLNEYLEALKIYMEHLRQNKKDVEYQEAIKSRSEIRKRRLIVGNSVNNLTTTSGSTASNSSSGASHHDIYRVNLPKREIPKFGGDVRNWRSFWASFNEIDNDPVIPTIEKYHYLLQSMVTGSRPHQIVSSYPPDGPSYALARDELKDKFGRTKTLIKVYVRDLLKLVVDNAKGSRTTDFTEMVTSLTAQVRNLEQLGLTHDTFGVILYPIVESCIPPETLNRYLQTPSVKEDITEILDFLNKEVQRQDETALAQGFSEISLNKESNKGKQGQKNKDQGKQATPTAASFSNTTVKAANLCGFCDGKHATPECRKAIAMTLEERKDALKKSQRCFRCLLPGHSSKKCNAKNVMCIICQQGHHTLMCWEHGKSKKPRDEDSVTANTASSTPADTKTDLANFIRRPEVLLQIVKVKIYGGNNKHKVIKAMFDPGSQCTYITSSVANELSLSPIGNEKVIHQTFGGILSDEVIHKVYNITISGTSFPFDGRFSFKASGIATIAKNINAPPVGPWMEECKLHGVQLSDSPGDDQDVDLLIGNDISPYLKVGMRSFTIPSGLVATETKVGWFLEGKIRGSEEKRSSKTMVCINMQITDKDVSNLWTLETLGIKDSADSQSRKELEEAALDHFRSTVKRDSTGRFQVDLPWIEGHPSLTDNRQHAVAHLHKTTKDLVNVGRLQDYHDIFMSWLAENIIEIAPVTTEGHCHYLPHRAVFKENSSTPTRPVFNASSKVGKQPSLNQCLEVGPNFLERITSIQTAFRLNAVGVTADIRKAFLQILLAESDRDSLRFLWWKDINKRKEIVELRHCRVVFGVGSSPFLLAAVIQLLLSTYAKRYPDTVEKLRNGFYVDNAVASFPTNEEAFKFQKEATELLAKGLFDLRGWEYGPSQEEKEVPVLGLIWNIKYDTLQFDLTKLKTKMDTPLTKRTVLSLLSTVFDPLGILAPFIIVAKIIFKKICLDKAKYSWDTLLPEPYISELETWRKQSLLISQVRIPRCVADNVQNSDKWSLHVLCDASKESYASCVYLRISSPVVRVHLLQARARVTPEKVLTIPRAELMACLIGARLALEVKKDIGAMEIPTTYYTDSSTAHTWICKTDSVWAKFVNNRVLEIREISDVASWKHIPGEVNMADLPSRGCSMDKFLRIKWWEGPQWLHGPEALFPISTPEVKEELVDAERKKTVVSAVVASVAPTFIDGLLKCGDYHKMLRVIVYLTRFVHNKFFSNKTTSRPVPTVTLEEMTAAERIVLLHVQVTTWNGIPPSGMKVEVDSNKIIRVVTRLLNGNHAESFKKPILLPANHPVVEMLIYKQHCLHSHAGVQYMQSLLREKYWIIRSRKLIRNIVHSCPICRVHLAKRCAVQEAPLPANRIDTVRCFEVIGVDFAGPLFVKNGSKVWVAMFTCAVYRAVHLEVVPLLSTAAFVNAFRKFVARRGRPRVVYSDNGTNFHGCVNQMKSVDWRKLQEYGTIHQIQWIFNPPSAAWWGGFWERLIGLMKQLLRRVLGKRILHHMELEVLVMEVEAIMNERPLTYISEDPNDLRPLSPSIFMRDLPVSGLPEMDLTDKELNRRMKFIQRTKEELRKRFQNEYLGQLVCLGKPINNTMLAPGDVVLVEVEHKKRWEWPIGVILELYPGKDKVMRTAKVRTTHGELVRPLQRLFVLEVRKAAELPPIESSRIKTVQPETKLPALEDDTNEDVPDLAEPEPVVITKYGRKVTKPNRFTSK